MKKLERCLLLGMLAAGTASAQDLPRGQIVDDVACADNPAQHYALYLPSNFTLDRTWPVVLLFDAGGRGRRGVERYQAGAERYGYIVAGSNNSRNGPWRPSLDAARAMATDVAARFPVDARRIYTAGMSGGARVAMMVARAAEDSSSRRIARRLLTTLRASTAGIRNPELQRLWEQISAASANW